MPSCDGSNCGACNCNCNTVEKIVYRDSDEVKILQKKVAELEKELAKKQYLEEIIKEIKLKERK